MGRRKKPQGKRRGGSPARQPVPAAARRKIPAYEQSWFPWVALVFVALLAYANAWPDVLVFDDREFLASDRFDSLGVSDFIRFFSQSLWEAGANTASLYRPMLLVSLGFENLVLGDRYSGYHLANVMRHALAVLLVFGFLREVFLATGHERVRAQWSSFLAALVFAVHPVLSDAVNSVFNGSDIYVTLFVVGGLWSLLVNYREKPVRAWLVAGLCYFIALLYKESAVAMPALAVVVLWMTGSGVWKHRVTQVLPVLVLLLPLVVYLGMRAEALEEFDSLASRISMVSAAHAEEPAAGEAVSRLPARSSNQDALRQFGLRFDPGRTAIAVSMWSDALQLMVWPHPLATLREPSTTPFWLAAVTQLGLLALCVFALVRKRPEPLLGLLLFYLAILPASRVIGEGALQPQLMDRMLYLPSVGLAICVAAGLAWLSDRFQPLVAVAFATVVVLAFIPVTWARNAEWSDEIGLLEHDFAVTSQNGQLLHALVRAQAVGGHTGRSMGLCTEYIDLVEKYAVVANECGKAFTQARQFKRAEVFYLQSLQQNPALSRTHFHLARLYVHMDRWLDAQTHFNLAIERERLPFLREFMSGIMLMDLYPQDHSRLVEARQHLENALQLQPRAAQAREVLEFLDQKL